MKKTLLLFLLLFTGFLKAQDLQEANFKAHIEFLASEELGGRLAGDKVSQTLAFDYILSALEAAEVEPLPNLDDMGQYFTFKAPPIVKPEENELKRFLKKWDFEEDFYPLSFTANATVKGKILDVGNGINSEPINDFEAVTEKDMEKIFLIDLALPKAFSDSRSWANWNSRYEAAKHFEPSAIVFYHSQQDFRPEDAAAMNNVGKLDIPVLYVSKETAERLGKWNLFPTKISTELTIKRLAGRNVVAAIDNGAEDFIIIGAHYDHIGKGEYGNSRYEGKTEKIHYGADDNASGVALMIEVAKNLRGIGYDQHNYVFVAFDAEELGLLGSKYFMEDLPVPKEKIKAMINFDMVGRLNEEDGGLQINGVGSALEWEAMLTTVSEATPTQIKLGTSALGASDHTPFYLDSIPVLHFFTGLHSDYHKPSDTPDKINYNGMITVAKVVLSLIEQLELQQAALTFQKTENDMLQQERGGANPKFSVTLGVLPDYTYEGEGMRIDGVSGGKAAENAGLIKGDVIKSLGDFDISDMASYMKALSKFKKGDETILKYERNREITTVPIKF